MSFLENNDVSEKTLDRYGKRRVEGGSAYITRVALTNSILKRLM
jgi:hypothetical protein